MKTKSIITKTLLLKHYYQMKTKNIVTNETKNIVSKIIITNEN